MEDNKIQQIYKYLLNIGFKDVTNTAIDYLENSNLKMCKDVLARMKESAYYYLLERDNKIGIESRWYVTMPEHKIFEKIYNKPNNIIRRLLTPEEDKMYCDIANGRVTLNLEEVTHRLLQNKLVEDKEDEYIAEANEKLKHLKNSQELVDLVEDYLMGNFDIGFPIYLIGKRSHWSLYNGRVIDEYRASFLITDFVSKRVVDIRTAYKYYKFSDRYR